MSTIPEHYPLTYENMIRSELQQMESRIQPWYGTFYDVPEQGKRFQVGAKSTSQQRSRGWTDTNPDQPARRERWLHMHDADTSAERDYRNNDEWIDELDAKRLGQIGDPTPQRVSSQVAACKRDLDKAIIAGLGGVAFTGATSPSTQAAFDTSYTITKDLGFSTTPSDTAPGGLNYAKVNRLTAFLGAANVTGQHVESASKVAIVCTHFELEDLLDDPKFVSKDYAEKLRAEMGEVLEYRNITFIPVSPELLPLSGSSSSYLRTCYGFSKSAIAIGAGTEKIHRVTQEGTKNSAILLHLVSGYTCARIYDYGCYKIESHRTDAQYADEVVFESL